jgi:hypothetical protein
MDTKMLLQDEQYRVPFSRSIPSIPIRMCILGSFPHCTLCVSYTGCIYPAMVCAYSNVEFLLFLEGSVQVYVK